MRRLVKTKNNLEKNMSDILIFFTLIMAPTLCFFKDTMQASINLYLVYYIFNLLVIIINSIYLTWCQPSLNRWELWVSVFLIIVGLFWMYQS